ncbi:AaceriAFR353Wp [[Ashbya] aceris (nom. inval.)]|nr:AaceriAFR353Wp [[Ashbya] aceris (nom. inval.)]
MGKKVPVIDLDEVGDEQQLAQVVRAVLGTGDAFLLKNYANYAQLRGWVQEMAGAPPDEKKAGFDASFTGVDVEDGRAIERYMWCAGGWQGAHQCDDALLLKIRARLLKVALYFGQLCLGAVGGADLALSGDHNSHELVRYYDSAEGAALPGLAFDYHKIFTTFHTEGLVSVFPVAQDVKVRRYGEWVEVDADDCLLVHTGRLLERLSHGQHSTHAIQIPMHSQMVHLSLAPPLDYRMGDSCLGQKILEMQIERFPRTANMFYATEVARIKARRAVAALKALFSVTESVLSMYRMNHPTAEYISIERLLPQLSTMSKRKISSADLLRIMYIWPDAYVVRTEGSALASIRLPKGRLMADASRKELFGRRADAWLETALNMPDEIPEEVPVHRLAAQALQSPKKERLRDSLLPNHHSAANINGISKKRASPTVNSVTLLERIRHKELKAAALLAQREANNQMFLKAKMKQVFDILLTLPVQRPYTLPYLRDLLVDSLRDSNNPIGDKEVELVLESIQSLISDTITVSTIGTEFKVYKWISLDKGEFLRRLY